MKISKSEMVEANTVMLNISQIFMSAPGTLYLVMAQMSQHGRGRILPQGLRPFVCEMRG